MSMNLHDKLTDQYWDFLGNYYFSLLYQLMNMKQREFIKVEWEAIIWNEAESGTDLHAFKEKHQLRMKLVCPPENLL